ncbi:type II toxin-antitoxin system HigB family toxin [Aequorivita capsosiphonis]|uniref:type II toxin-antitoxin system HigB family toxin n=1 Tax=Aequorivita capsosiphonis TaxID=487317 RepID=UPI000410BB6C|nr:type II toxin-antitoxin system HigB family toxin [Aequorivita capsosiphonis]
MRIVTVKVLKEFSKDYPLAKIPLLHWYDIAKHADWQSLNDGRMDFNSVDYVGNNRYVFNIKGNDFRLICIIIFVSKKIYIRFLGTHADYDKIDAKNI